MDISAASIHRSKFSRAISCRRSSTVKTKPPCGVLFRVDYQLADGSSTTSGRSVNNTMENISAVDLDLSPLAGQDVRFVFTILSLGQASGDRALWVEPRIVRATPTP